MQLEPDYCAKCGHRPRGESLTVNNELRFRVVCLCGRMGYHAVTYHQATVNWNIEQQEWTQPRTPGDDR